MIEAFKAVFKKDIRPPDLLKVRPADPLVLNSAPSQLFLQKPKESLEKPKGTQRVPKESLEKPGGIPWGFLRNPYKNLTEPEGFPKESYLKSLC